MKKILLACSFLLLACCLQAQIKNPVSWTFSSKKLANKLYEVQLVATIAPKWHLYAQDAGKGPEPTSIQFDANPLVVLDGKVLEKGKLEKSFDANFNSVLKYYSSTVTFTQKVKLKSPAATVLKGTITYMVCDDHQCLPPRDIPFSVKLGGQ